MIYELRHYVPAPGKEAALAARFREHTAKILAKLGRRVVSAWESADGSGEVWYVIEYESMEDLKRTTERFLASPEWLRAKALTESEGPLFSKAEAFALVRSDLFG